MVCCEGKCLHFMCQDTGVCGDRCTQCVVLAAYESRLTMIIGKSRLSPDTARPQMSRLFSQLGGVHI
jgi:hypothetical protein